MTPERPLAAIVTKDRVDEAIGGIKAAGRYDSRRRIQQAGPNTVAIPVLSPSPGITDADIRVQPDPEWRIRDLDDLLARREFSLAERSRAPQSWSILGNVIVARFDGCKREREVGEALLELHHQATTVLSTDGVVGPHREPNVRVVAGEGDTETVHVEHGTKYAMDLEAVMFSPGNKAERVRMGTTISPDETVFDMFAGIGYFTLPMARAGATVIATERNPGAYRYLLENVMRNGVVERVEPYRIDCRALRPRADRVVMGYFDAVEYVSVAMEALRSGGTLHLHDVAPSADRWDAAETAIERAAGERLVTIEGRRTVKSHSPGMEHVVVDARVD